jgi:uncharacterized membrane protein
MDDEAQVSVERIRALEERVRVLEALLAAAPPQPPVARAEPFPRPRPVAARERQAPERSRPELDLEELLGGRVLAWVGGVAVVLAVVFFLVMAVHNGWIGRGARVGLAFLGSSLLVAVGVWAHEHKGRTQAALAALAAGFAALYASDTAATALYHLLPDAAGLGLALVFGVAASAAAVRWASPAVAGIGIVGSLLAPVLVDAGTSTGSLAFMVVALLGAVGVLLWRRWDWLTVVAYAASAPQAAAWVHDERSRHLGLALAVTAAFWLLYVVAALGHETLVRTAALRPSSSLLGLANSAAPAGGGWWPHHDAGHGRGATAWVAGLAVATLLLAAVAARLEISGEIVALLGALAVALAAVALALALDGPALVAGWSAEALVAALLARRSGDPRGYLGGAAALVLALGHTLRFEAQPRGLVYEIHSLPRATAALALVAAALVLAAELLPDGKDWREHVRGARIAAAAIAVYLCSLVVVQLAGPAPDSVAQTSQLALSAFWAALGLVLFVGGLVRDERAVRLGGLGLLGLAVVKVFLLDLAKLGSIWRVGSFLALGLLLLSAAFAYQRLRRETRL